MVLDPHSELVQLAGDVVDGAGIGIPVGVDVVGSGRSEADLFSGGPVKEASKRL
jgi:hypothetical protein